MTNDDSPRAYHHGNLRAELLDTAIEQLREQGTEDLSLRALARAIGVSQTAPYRHFADKGELLAAMATRGYRNLLATLESAGRSAGGNPADQLVAFAHAYVAYAAENPQLFKRGCRQARGCRARDDLRHVRCVTHHKGWRRHHVLTQYAPLRNDSA